MPLAYVDGRYRDGDALLTETEVTALRDRQIDTWGEELARLTADALGIGETVVAIEFPTSRIEAFAARFLAKAQDILISAYVWAAGGAERVSEAGWSTVAELVERQTVFGRGFVDALRGGGVSEAQAVARSRSYAGAAVEAFERGKSSLRGADAASDDCMPGSGCTQCLTQCRCSLAYDEAPDGRDLLVYWRTGSEDPCPDCRGFAAEWNPRRVVLGGAA